MALSIQQLITAQDADSFKKSIVLALVALGIPADTWKAGGVANSIISVIAYLLSVISSLLASTIQGFFLPLASGAPLILLAKYMYGVTAPSATFASGVVTLVNSGGGVYTQAAGTVTVLNSTTGYTYTNTDAFTLNALQTLDINIAATTIGTVGNASPLQIDTMVTALLGVTCSNASSVVGTDGISDEALRNLCLASLGARSVFGPRGAYAYAIATATNPITGNLVNVNRYSLSSSSHTGTVTIYVASPAGLVATEDLIGIASNIELLARPEGVTVVLNTAEAVPYTRTINVWVQVPTGLLATTVTAAINAQLILFFERYPIGGAVANDDTHTSFQGLFGAAVTGAIGTAVTSVGGVLISTQGATDLALSANQVPSDNVTIVTRLIVSGAGTGLI